MHDLKESGNVDEHHRLGPNRERFLETRHGLLHERRREQVAVLERKPRKVLKNVLASYDVTVIFDQQDVRDHHVQLEKVADVYARAVDPVAQQQHSGGGCAFCHWHRQQHSANCPLVSKNSRLHYMCKIQKTAMRQ